MVGSAVVTMDVSSAARKTDEQREPMMMTVWRVVRGLGGVAGQAIWIVVDA